MLERIKSSLRGQISLVLAASALGVAFAYFLNFDPIVRLSLKTAIAGSIFGVLSAAVFTLLFKRIDIDSEVTLLPFTKLPKLYDQQLLLLGRALASATGEEFVLRVLIFSYLGTYSLPTAFLINFLLSFALNWRKHVSLNYPLLLGCIGTMFAAYSYYAVSAFAVVTARFVFELSIPALSPRVPALNKASFKKYMLLLKLKLKGIGLRTPTRSPKHQA